MTFQHYAIFSLRAQFSTYDTNYQIFSQEFDTNEDLLFRSRDDAKGLGFIRGKEMVKFGDMCREVARVLIDPYKPPKPKRSRPKKEHYKLVPHPTWKLYTGPTLPTPQPSIQPLTLNAVVYLLAQSSEVRQFTYKHERQLEDTVKRVLDEQVTWTTYSLDLKIYRPVE